MLAPPSFLGPRRHAAPLAAFLPAHEMLFFHLLDLNHLLAGSGLHLILLGLSLIGSLLGGRLRRALVTRPAEETSGQQRKACLLCHFFLGRLRGVTAVRTGGPMSERRRRG